MKLEVIILIKCNEVVERAQMYAACTLVVNEVRKIKGIENAVYTGNADADVTAFANWEESDVSKYVQQLKSIAGVEDVIVKQLIPV